MRMTRAALRAQEAEDDLQTQVEAKLREQGLSSHIHENSSSPLIHEDVEEEASYSSSLNNTGDSDSNQATNGLRLALRDITAENYPTADISTEVIDGSKASIMDEKADEQEMKTGKKAKGKKGRTAAPRKKNTLVTEQELQSPENRDEEAQNTSEELTSTENPLGVTASTTELEDVCAEVPQESQPVLNLEALTADQDTTQEEPRTETSLAYEADLSQETTELTPETPFKATETVSKTPKFNPDIHLPIEQVSNLPAENSEDSFVDSIKTRSPSKFSQSLLTLQSQEQSYFATGTPLAHTPTRKTSQTLSPSPQRIEDSVEAIDALEDAIEKFAEDLPVVETLHYESPVRSRRTPAKTPAKVQAKNSAKTPAKTPSNARAKTPAKVSTSSLEKSAVKTPQNLRENMASTKRDTVKERVKAIELKPTAASHSRVTSIHVLKKDAPEVKPTLKSRHMATKSVPHVASTTASTMSFSNSPAKQAANVPKKRVTSGGVLVTSKPGFVPAKSSKPTTTSNFSLPGEAIAAKLKAQREERAKREESEPEKKAVFKARPAPARTARPSVMPRENKASTARLSVRQASGENKENVAPARSTSGSTTTKPSPVTTSTMKPANTAVANSSVRRTTIAPKATSTIESRKSMAVGTSATTTSSNPRITSLSSGQPSTMTKAEAAQQKLKGKEVYGRLKGTVQQMEDEKKAKEEAARKARAEAAERGRLASREWAEKQKKKISATATTKVEGQSVNVAEVSI